MGDFLIVLTIFSHTHDFYLGLKPPKMSWAINMQRALKMITKHLAQHFIKGLKRERDDIIST